MTEQDVVDWLAKHYPKTEEIDPKWSAVLNFFKWLQENKPKLRN